MKIYSYKKIRGFTIIEALVSAMIVSIVILGPLTVSIQASSYAKQTKDTMIAIYLAQEAVELLRHQQDSIYLRCSSSESSACPMINGELPREAAWRLFNERLSSTNNGVSCLSNQAPGVCAYDFIDMVGNEDVSPSKYDFTGSQCSTLSVNVNGLYVCTGAHGSGAIQTNFSRSISITPLITFSGTDAEYNTDLRVVVTINFKRSNGYSKQIKVVDFLHARS
jgi:type II secretory pathway pseudopilin PulG